MPHTISVHPISTLLGVALAGLCFLVMAQAPATGTPVVGRYTVSKPSDSLASVLLDTATGRCWLVQTDHLTALGDPALIQDFPWPPRVPGESDADYMIRVLRQPK